MKQTNRGWIAAFITLTILLATALAPRAEAYPLDPWGGLTAKNSVAVTPFLFVYPSDPSLAPLVYLAFGASDKLDVMAGFGGYMPLEPVGFSLDSFELFPRYFVTDNLAVVAHFYYSPGSSLVTAPEIHYTQTWEKFAFTANVGYTPFLDLASKEFSAGGLYAYLAPEYYFSERCWGFVEVDPSFDFGGELALSLVPGFGAALDKDQYHTFAIGLDIPVYPEVGAVSVGIWYSTSFGGE